MKKKICVDMSCSIIHNGHTRLLKKANKFGDVVVALTSDEDIKKHKKLIPELNFKQRKEILESIKYVSKVIKSGFFITDDFLKKNKLDLLVHGHDNSNKIPKKKLIIFSRTLNISSTEIRKISFKNVKKLFKKK
jgi:cytidyltransferase-like protein